MKIGDKVRFLSETGGGCVAGFQNNGIVLVEDEDGFQIPTNINDLVVVNDDDYSTRRIVEYKNKHIDVEDKDEDYDPADRPITFSPPIDERTGGDILSAYLAFVPIDIREITSTRFETYFINDSNYYMYYAYLVSVGTGWKLRSIGEVEPNTKVFIEEFEREELVDMEHAYIQLLAYKKEKVFSLKSTIDVQLHIDSVKFYKLHTFKENDFFEQRALIYTIIEKDRPIRPIVIDANQIKMKVVDKVTKYSYAVPPAAKHTDKNLPVVVDLHAKELLETTAGMSSVDILNYQLETFRKTMKQYEKQKGKKIVFIHGKGEGVLRHALINELRHYFKHCIYQDASFQEYGYGATQVTVK